MELRRSNPEGFFMTDPESATGPFLTDLSPNDKPWDKAKKQARQVQGVYARETEFLRYSDRMNACGDYLDFASVADAETGEVKYKLHKAHFCRVRYCPVCQWRRSLFWAAKFHQALPGIMEEYPKGKFLYLVLTVKNCGITDLREQLRAMNEAWRRMLKRPVFKHVHGWIRTTEVTRGKDGSAHPHFNVLLFVSPSYFAGQNYLSQDAWAEMWKSCARLDYDPMIWITTAKKKKKAKSASEEGELGNEAASAAKEVLKYSVKPADMVASPEWFHELTRQTHHLRFLASGGCFKDAFKDEPTEEDLLHVGEEETPPEDVKELSRFLWRDSVRRYVYERTLPAAHSDVSLVDRVNAKAALGRILKPSD